MRSDEEHKLQVMVIELLEIMGRKGAFYCFSIPNAGIRTLRMGARMKPGLLPTPNACSCFMDPPAKTSRD